jgi:hypothetical protein
MPSVGTPPASSSRRGRTGPGSIVADEEAVLQHGDRHGIRPRRHDEPTRSGIDVEQLDGVRSGTEREEAEAVGYAPVRVRRPPVPVGREHARIGERASVVEEGSNDEGLGGGRGAVRRLRRGGSGQRRGLINASALRPGVSDGGAMGVTRRESRSEDGAAKRTT